MIKQTIITSLVVVSLLTPATALAQTMNMPKMATTSAVASPKARALTTAQERQLTNLKQKASAEIDRRLTVLNQQLSRISANTALKADEKLMLSGQIQEVINKLTTLKTKITADTDVVTLRADVATMKEAYRDYGFMIVQAPILATSDQVLAVCQNMATISAQIQVSLNESSSSAVDKAIVEKSLSMINTKLTSVNTQVEAVKNTVLALEADGFPGNRTQLQSARNKLVVAITDLKTVRRELQTVYQNTKKTDMTLKPTPASAAAQVKR